METTLDILEALKSKTGAASDYKLAQILGVTRQSISIYRSGVGSFSDDMCVKVASILEVEPFLILAIVYSERTKSNEVKTAWKSLLERLGSVAAMCLLATGINALQPAPVLASEVGGMAQEYTLCECYYMDVFISHLSTLCEKQNYVPS